MCLEYVKKFLGSLIENRIHFKNHFYKRAEERPIDDELVKRYLQDPSRLMKVERQEPGYPWEEKYKIWFKLSQKYDLVLIIVVSGEDLYILTGWNRRRKWRKG